MTPFKQLFRHKPDEGVHGDCFRTAIGCLLDMDPASVPHFCDVGVTAEQRDLMVEEFLAEHRMRVIKIAYPGSLPLGDLLATMQHCNYRLHHLLSGMSRTGVNHVVVCKNGKIVHDPSLDDSGIVGPCDDGNWWIEFLGVDI